MSNRLFDDPKARRAYIWTKVAVFAAAAAATWPLSKVVGPRAWWGLGAFGVLLLVLALVVLSSGSDRTELDDSSDEDDDDLADPDRPIELPIEDFIDLHPFPPKDIPHIVEDYLAAAHAEGFREVRLIHGRGLGVQRERVRGVLSRHPLVTQYHDRTHDRGGWGATVAHLKDS